ncbi:hypothetical protein [Caulobacter sp. NIBR2454]|uniref:hypothetical protein n=1 Tax=Caulobacter sp. NIBR2454 TaxID=3015996 RepID=UPI0022B6B12D|nr:hypothetical protein [Caulobacter sp. NIBR2454]
MINIEDMEATARGNAMAAKRHGYALETAGPCSIRVSCRNDGDRFRYFVNNVQVKRIAAAWALAGDFLREASAASGRYLVGPRPSYSGAVGQRAARFTPSSSALRASPYSSDQT